MASWITATLVLLVTIFGLPFSRGLGAEGESASVVSWEPFMWKDGAYSSDLFHYVTVLDIDRTGSFLWMLASRTDDPDSFRVVKIDIHNDTYESFDLPQNLTLDSFQAAGAANGSFWVVDQKLSLGSEATDVSLWRLSGVEWTCRSLDDLEGIGQTTVTDLCEGPGGSVWIGGRSLVGGEEKGWALRLLGSTRRLYQFLPGLGTDLPSVNCMASTSNQLWTGTANGLFCHDYSTDSWIYYWSPSDERCYSSYVSLKCINSRVVVSLWAVGDTLLVGTTRTYQPYRYAVVCRHLVEDDSWRTLFVMDQVEAEIGMLCCFDDMVWVLEKPTTPGSGIPDLLWRYRDSPVERGWEFHQFMKWPEWTSRDRPRFTSMVCDGAGNLYLGTEGQGLIKMLSARASGPTDAFWNEVGGGAMAVDWRETLLSLEGGAGEILRETFTIAPGHRGGVMFDAAGDHRYFALEIEVGGIRGGISPSGVGSKSFDDLKPGDYSLQIVALDLAANVPSNMSWWVMVKQARLTPIVAGDLRMLPLSILALALISILRKIGPHDRWNPHTYQK